MQCQWQVRLIVFSVEARLLLSVWSEQPPEIFPENAVKELRDAGKSRCALVDHRVVSLELKAETNDDRKICSVNEIEGEAEIEKESPLRLS